MNTRRQLPLPIRTTTLSARRFAHFVLVAIVGLGCAAPDVLAQERALEPPTLLDGMAPDDDELDMRTTPVVRAVQRAADSVVSIYLLDSRDERRGAGQPEGQGSGVIIDRTGLVITNWHVVYPLAATSTSRRFVAEVKLKDGRSRRADLLSSSADEDLALLQMRLEAGESVQPAVPGDSKTLMVGETVIAIGNPQGHANTVTVGVLSATDRSIGVQAPDGVGRRYGGLLQTDAAINRGNSGGALLDITGKLIGINNAMGVGVENIGFAIPVNTVRQVFQDVLLSSEHFASAWLGMRVDNRTDRGAVISDVEGIGPAARAGLRTGDRVRRAAGAEIRNAIDYARSTLRAVPGEPFPLVIERGGRELTVAPVPWSKADYEVLRRTGLELEVVTSRDDYDLLKAATLQFYERSRARSVRMLPAVLRVTAVAPDSPSAAIGFESGDVLFGLGSYSMLRGPRPFVSIEDFADRIRGRREVEVRVLRDGEALSGVIDLERPL